MYINGTEWLFDPTVTKSLASEDYLILENWVKANKDAGYMDAKYGNSEYWFGGSSYYVNFNIQLAKRRSNDPDGWCRQMIKRLRLICCLWFRRVLN